mmetsp:Transcript_127452/g.318225  ORF Transcript_127452/g.318225 Transcript_127452/m.318225 type:complete len:202 (-) Transcript_127452:110-715(-)
MRKRRISLCRKSDPNLTRFFNSAFSIRNRWLSLSRLSKRCKSMPSLPGELAEAGTVAACASGRNPPKQGPSNMRPTATSPLPPLPLPVRHKADDEATARLEDEIRESLVSISPMPRRKTGGPADVAAGPAATSCGGGDIGSEVGERVGQHNIMSLCLAEVVSTKGALSKAASMAEEWPMERRNSRHFSNSAMRCFIFLTLT